MTPWPGARTPDAVAARRTRALALTKAGLHAAEVAREINVCRRTVERYKAWARELAAGPAGKEMTYGR